MPSRKQYTPATAAIDVEAAFKLLEGRWKLLILFHLFGGQVRRFSDLQRLIPGVTQKMLTQQLRRLEEDGIVKRTDHHEVPPRVDYRLSEWGQALCPALDAILEWAERRDEFEPTETASQARSRGARVKGSSSNQA